VGSHSEILFSGSDGFSLMGKQLEMFGPVEVAPRNLGGRPRFNKVKEYQSLVDRQLMAGSTLGEIAAAVGVSVPTLRLYFSGRPSWQAMRARWRGRLPGGVQMKPGRSAPKKE
jgi:hypothetical protein